MKVLLYLASLLLVAATCSGIAFDHNEYRHRHLFDIRAGISNSSSSPSSPGEIIRGAAKKGGAAGEKERHHNIILDSIHSMERKLHDAVEQEVETLFHKSDHPEDKKTEVKNKAKAAVERGSKKVQQVVHDHNVCDDLPFEDRPYPYSWPQTYHGKEHADQKLLQAIGSAEKAFLHAVEEEVETIFHKMEHHHHDRDTTTKAQSVLKEGVEKTKTKVSKAHEERKDWLKDSNKFIEEYILSDFE